VSVQQHSFKFLTLRGVQSLGSRSGLIIRRERAPGICRRGGWAEPIHGVHAYRSGNILPLPRMEPPFPGYPKRNDYAITA